MLVDSPADGRTVENGDRLFTLKATDLELEILTTLGEIEVAQARVTQLEQRLVGDPESAQKVIETTQMLNGLRDKLVELELEKSKLAIVADAAGLFIAPSPADDQRNFVSPNASLKMDLMSKTLGSDFVERGELIGLVGTDDRWVVNAFVREQDLRRSALEENALFGSTNIRNDIQRKSTIYYSGSDSENARDT